MGKVRDIYMRYVTSGGEFVGHCLSLLSVLRTDFVISPPYFYSNDYSWIEDCRLLQFPIVGLIAGLEKIFPYMFCLSSFSFRLAQRNSSAKPCCVVVVAFASVRRSAIKKTVCCCVVPLE